VVSRFAVSRLTRQSTPDLSIDECASSSWVQSQHTIHHGFEESISQNLFIKPSLEPPQSEKWLQRQVISELTSMQDTNEDPQALRPHLDPPSQSKRPVYLHRLARRPRREEAVHSGRDPFQRPLDHAA